MKLVRWGRHGGGAEVSRHRRRELPGEKVIWRPRGMNGAGGAGNWEGSGTMSYGRICLKCEGSYSSTLSFRLLGLGLCTEGRG